MPLHKYQIFFVYTYIIRFSVHQAVYVCASYEFESRYICIVFGRYVSLNVEYG